MRVQTALKHAGFKKTKAFDTKGRREFYNAESVWPWVYGCGATGDHGWFVVVNTFDQEMELDAEELFSWLEGQEAAGLLQSRISNNKMRRALDTIFGG